MFLRDIVFGDVVGVGVRKGSLDGSKVGIVQAVSKIHKKTTFQRKYPRDVVFIIPPIKLMPFLLSNDQLHVAFFPRCNLQTHPI